MPDNQQLERVFQLLNRGSGVAWTAKATKGHALVGNRALTAESLQKHAAQQEGWDFFICLNSTQKNTTKPSKRDIANFSVIGLDIDPPSGMSLDPLSVGAAVDSSLTNLTGYRNNHVIVSSGRGVWAWVFVEPTLLLTDTAQDDADALIKGFTDAVGAQSLALHGLKLDSACADLSRIARCPGTVNSKTGQPARIIMDYEPVDPLPLTMVESLARPFVRNPAPPMPMPVSGESLFDIAPHMNVTTRQFVLTGANSNVESRHRRAFSSAKNLREIGVTRDLAEFCIWSGAERSTPNLNRSDPGFVQRVIAQVWS